MHSKIFQTFFQLAFVLSLIFIFNGNAECQLGFVENNFKLNFFSGGEDKIVNVSRPRVYKKNENSTEPSAGKASTNLSFEHRAFEEINQQRVTQGLRALSWSDDAAKIARLHSENMANFKFFSHAGLDGSMVNARADSFGISKWRAIGENIAYNHGYPNPIEFTVERWMQSPGHRENILNDRWSESGIGIAITADGTYYFTQVFLLRK